MPSFQLDYCLRRLQMFVFRSDVQLSVWDRAVVGLSGVDLDLEPDAVLSDDQGLYVRLSQSRLFYRIAELSAAWNAASVAAVGYQAWQLLEVKAGLPCINKATVEAFIPQMLHLQHLNAVSFTKGCYTGQEIVARTHYLGKVKRQMYLARSQGACPQAGDGLFCTQDTRGQSAGTVVQAALDPDGFCYLLLVAQDKWVAAGSLRLHSAEGESLKILSLPYATESK